MMRKITDTEWEHEFATATGEDNDQHVIRATEQGLEIDNDVIPWEQIDVARAKLARQA